MHRRRTSGDPAAVAHPPLRRVRKLARLLAVPAYRRALAHRVAAALEHRDAGFEHEFATVVDVGAHQGQFATFAADRFPSAHLICVEPQERPRARLARVLRDHPSHRIVDVALAAEAGERAFHVSHADDSSSLLAPGERHLAAWPEARETGTIRVVTTTLDAVLADAPPARPCLLKLDVQGAELEVLAGGKELLERVDEVLVECSFVELYRGQPLAGDVVAHIVARGFRLVGVGAITRTVAGRQLQADFLFSRATGEPGGGAVRPASSRP